MLKHLRRWHVRLGDSIGESRLLKDLNAKHTEEFLKLSNNEPTNKNLGPEFEKGFHQRRYTNANKHVKRYSSFPIKEDKRNLQA